MMTDDKFLYPMVLLYPEEIITLYNENYEHFMRLAMIKVLFATSLYITDVHIEVMYEKMWMGNIRYKELHDHIAASYHMFVRTVFFDAVEEFQGLTLDVENVFSHVDMLESKEYLTLSEDFNNLNYELGKLLQLIPIDVVDDILLSISRHLTPVMYSLYISEPIQTALDIFEQPEFNTLIHLRTGNIVTLILDIPQLPRR